MDILSIIRSSLFAFVSSVARHLLMMGLTWLVAKNMIDANTSDQLLTLGPMVAAAVAWSFVDKYVLAKVNLAKIETALSLPAGSSPARLDEEVRKLKANEAKTN